MDRNGGYLMKIHIIEDLFVHRSLISNALEELTLNNSEIEIIPITDYLSFYENIETFTILDTDIFLIDIDLNTFYTGIDYAKKIRLVNKNCYIIFLTADDNRGIEIINQNINATTYLVKGTFDPQVLKQSLQKELYKIESIVKKLYTDLDDRHIKIQVDDTFFFIKIADILYIETIKTMKGYLLFKTHSQELIIRSTMKDIKKELEHVDYIYLGFKSLIINLKAITSFNKNEGEIIFTNNDYIFGGRKIIEKLIDALN